MVLPKREPFVREKPANSFEPHHGELVFGFVLQGSAELELDGSFALGPAICS